MRTVIYLLAALLLGTLFATLPGTTVTKSRGIDSPSGSYRSELEYLKAVNSVAPPRDPQLLFLLMAQYSNANRQGEGAEFFSAPLKEFGPRLTDAQQALYLSAIGLLRAQHAFSVSLLHRVGYVKETIAILEQAKQLSGGKIFVVNWIAGIYPFCGKIKLKLEIPAKSRFRSLESKVERRTRSLASVGKTLYGSAAFSLSSNDCWTTPAVART